MSTVPIELEFKSAQSSKSKPVSIRTFSSYSFDRNILTPAGAFRFTAPAVDASVRKSVRSGDTVSLFIRSANNVKIPIATGFIDETDTHITPKTIDYVLTGRDTLGQLVDNAAVDTDNKIINAANLTIDGILNLLLKNTRIPAEFLKSQIPNGSLLIQTTPGETKISVLQKYLEFTNCLIWAIPDGRVMLGKPNFSQNRSGSLVMKTSDPRGNNCVEARVKRNVNQSIRKIITQLQTMDQVDPGSFTIQNNDRDILKVIKNLVGRSVYRRFSYGQGADAVNQISQIGNSSGAPNVLGQALSMREIARENMKILDVECIVPGHLNEHGKIYNIDQVYNVQIEDDDVNEDLYVYSCTYNLTAEMGKMTHMRLCRLGTICAAVDATPRVSSASAFANQGIS